MVKGKPVKPSEAELLELGKKLQQFYDSGYVNKNKALGYSFLKGLAGGFGAFLGGTILIALLLWILGFFDQLTLIQRAVDVIQSSIK